MRTVIKTKNKKGLSEIIAYVLLVVMSLSLASGVYIWLKTNIPADRETCSEDISISIKNYTCKSDGHIITLTIENKGFFSIAGFFIKGSNRTDTLPIISLYTDENKYSSYLRGRYDFKSDSSGKLLPGKYETAAFRYGDVLPLVKVQIQPFIIGEKTKTVLLCDKGIINQEFTGCN